MRTDRNGKQNLTYYTSTPIVDSDGKRYNRIAIGSDEFRQLVETGQTFQFKRSYPNENGKWYDPDIINVVLTCRADKRKRGGLYYSAKWKDPRSKKQKRAYIGKAEAITLDKLEAIAARFANE